MGKIEKISVIIPTYNSANFIEKTLESLVSQTVLPEEIIIVDDGSKDNTVEIINKWTQHKKSLNIKLKQNQHKGPGEARNIGIQLSTGDWISFLDSDDTWEPKKIYEVKKTIRNNININFITHYEYFINNNNKKSVISKKLKLFKNSKFDIKSYCYNSNIFSTSAVTCKKDLLIKFGKFDKKLPNAQDYDLWLKLLPYINLFIIEKNLGTYFQRKSNITSRPYYKRILSELKICFRYKKYVSLGLFTLKFVKILFSKRWFELWV